MWYFAHPYTGNKKENFVLANKRTAFLIDNGYDVFSPISHSHLVDKYRDISYDRWMELSHKMIKLLPGIILPPKWRESNGCLKEFGWARKYQKEIKLFNDIKEEINEQ